MKRGRAREILTEVQAAVKHWPEYAEETGVPPELITKIAGAQRTGMVGS